jgi:predicted nucleic-acid-binding Zn-ribbon protein
MAQAQKLRSGEAAEILIKISHDDLVDKTVQNCGYAAVISPSAILI